eukprot:2594206-Rhodomonas_salina.1
MPHKVSALVEVKDRGERARSPASGCGSTASQERGHSDEGPQQDQREGSHLQPLRHVSRQGSKTVLRGAERMAATEANRARKRESDRQREGQRDREMHLDEAVHGFSR